MSTVKEAKITYLQNAELRNYKSIKEAATDFKPGLNIIIGKNGSGKTNFLIIYTPLLISIGIKLII